MIKDALPLRDDHLPNQVQHRHTQRDRLASALEPAVNDDQPHDAILQGPTGTGKTCISRYVTKHLEREALDVSHQYINCWQDYTRFRVLYRALEGLNRTIDIHRRSTPKDELIERLHEYNGAPYILILDEVDQLQDHKVLYDLYREPNVSMILITNREEELFAQLDDRVRSRLRGTDVIEFNPYRTHELTSILEKRAEIALESDAVDHDCLEEIADRAAGDARVAIALLRSAARKAESEGGEVITTDLIDEAAPLARQEVKRKSVEQLNPHQQAIYEIIEDAGEITPGELYERYSERVEDAVTKRTVRNYIDKMEHYNLVETRGENRSRTYSSV